MATELFAERDFRWRSDEITRIESFSDAVFGFAVTLLVVSLKVPRSYHELIAAMQNFPAFAVCFAILAQIWFAHYRYFRRYALQTPLAVALSCVLLFVLLFYVYPLKFLFVAVFSGAPDMTVHQGRTLYMIFGLGYAAVSTVLWLLYAHAWSHRDTLELNPLERLLTRHSLIDHAAQIAIGMIAVVLALALPVSWLPLAGYFYFAIGVYYWIARTLFGRERRTLRARLARPISPRPPAAVVATAATSPAGASGGPPN
jgi:uncharacterized membrane protein